jgi:uroporphyrinogen-III synthase
MNIAITRLKEKATDDKERCLRHGHDCYSVSPLFSRLNTDEIDEFIRMAKQRQFDCIFFTSALPASLIAPKLATVPLPRVIAIGPHTAKILRSSGVPCEVLPQFYSKAFVPYLGSWIAGKQIGIPRADVPNDALISAINEAGATVCEYRCYGLCPTYELIDLSDSSIDAILFTSSMSFTASVWKRHPGLLTMAIGEVTAEVMTRAGMRPDIVGDGSLEGTLDEINMYLLLHS